MSGDCLRAVSRSLRAVEGPITFARKAEAIPEPELGSKETEGYSAVSDTRKELANVPNLQAYRWLRAPKLLEVLLQCIEKDERVLCQAAANAGTDQSIRILDRLRAGATQGGLTCRFVDAVVQPAVVRCGKHQVEVAGMGRSARWVEGWTMHQGMVKCETRISSV